MTSWKIFSIGFLGAVSAIVVWIALNQFVNPDLRSPILGKNGFDSQVESDILGNPQVIVRAFKRMRTQRREAQTDEIAQIISARGEGKEMSPRKPTIREP